VRYRQYTGGTAKYAPYEAFLVEARQELADQLGEPLTASQGLMIDRVAWLKLHLRLYDEKGLISDRERAVYATLSNSLTRILTRLIGRKPVGRPKKVYRPTLSLDELRRQSQDAAE
jgi:hypothetical protein